ncbi:MAG TPA: hypothetical protein VK186_14980 [Candidatus Deferrimicrobium sp.]|nr:hypothetical protein [Candidatus Deferrimicrobium sp.]
MVHRLNAEQKRFPVKLMKEVGKGLLVLIVVVMAFKFMTWNLWKLTQAVDIASEINKELPAVNLAILEKNNPLFQKSFVPNEKGNYYLINHFDIAPYLQDANADADANTNAADSGAGHIKITVNRREIASFLLFRFNRYHVLYTGDYYFIFMKANSGIEDQVRVTETFPGIAHALFKLAVAGKEKRGEEKKKNLYRYYRDVEKELTYGSAKLSIPLPGLFKKGKLYEITFDYKVTGEAKPMVILDPPLNRHELETVTTGSYRKAVVMFSPPMDMTEPGLYLVGRSNGKKGRFAGTVFFKDIAVYRYDEEYPWLKQFYGMQVSYLDLIDRVKEEFVGVKFFQK